METVVAVEVNEELKFEDSEIGKTSSESSFQEQVTDPIVYKLVRVDGDGRLVPATDDEVMEVEDLLEDDKSETNFVVDTGQTKGCTSIDAEGSVESENIKADGDKSNAPHDTAVDAGKLNTQMEEIAPSSAPSSSSGPIDQSGECSVPSCGLIESGASTSAAQASSKPDFSKLKGEICLDDLSVRELRETFKATFGRETSVEDKQWLKRRISMGLSNSCDVSVTTFKIEDNRVVKKGKVASCKTMDDSLAKDRVVGGMRDSCGSVSVTHNNQIENFSNVSGKRVQNAKLEYNLVIEDLHMEERAAKRVRKPTRRYIEEASEVESREYSGKVISPVKDSGHGQSDSRAPEKIHSVGKPLVTRQDSLGGSEVWVPYVSRIRRGRPRENIMALMKLEPSGMGIAVRLVKETLSAPDPRVDNEIGDKVLKASLAPALVEQRLISEPEEDEEYLEEKTTELEKDVDLGHLDSSADNSDDNLVTVPTSKGGMRRKHHRPWTLSEVVKLVEGVARYGAGRWSEIKRIAFATYSYRTSVDLKDKWRNLLRASLAQLPAEKGVQNSRKHSSIPIPAPILSRVRELAEMQSQVIPDLSSIKFAGHYGRSVHEMRSGYL